MLFDNIAAFSSARVNCSVTKEKASEFEFAILNIATNAGHAMPLGGRLEIHVKSFSIADDDGLNLPSGNYLRITFLDNGQGMPPDVLSHAFEPFFTTREAGTGTGLGLSQVHNFAKQSGGLATIESVVGRGTNVAVYLPLLNIVPADAHAPRMATAGSGA